MTERYVVDSPDPIERRVLFAVELYDPIAQSLVHRGVVVKAAGLTGEPIVSHSGRLVWRVEGDAWPGSISVDPHRLPFAPHVQPGPPRPDDLEKATATERLVRITLRPTRAYAFDDGITVVRGKLCESDADDSPAVPGARVQLAWHDESGEWLPHPPTDDVDPDAPRSPREIETDANGEFAVFLRLAPAIGAEPDVDEHGFLAVRLQFTRFPGDLLTLVTPEDFPFVEDTDADHPAPKGRIPEGRPLPRYLTLGWSELKPI